MHNMHSAPSFAGSESVPSAQSARDYLSRPNRPADLANAVRPPRMIEQATVELHRALDRVSDLVVRVREFGDRVTGPYPKAPEGEVSRLDAI